MPLMSTHEQHLHTGHGGEVGGVVEIETWSLENQKRKIRFFSPFLFGGFVNGSKKRLSKIGNDGFYYYYLAC